MSQEELLQKKLQNEIELQELDKKIKLKEVNKWRILQPTNVTIIVALIGLITAAITNFIQRKNQLVIEERKFQYSVYQKALEAKDNITAAKILDFYIKAGLLPGKEGKYSQLIEDGKLDEVPTYGGIYKDITLPKTDNSDKLIISNHFVKGKGTEYMLSYNAKERINLNELKTIVIHSSFSSTLSGAAKFLTDTISGKASVHILIDKNGKITQLVPFNFMSFHANQHNKNSIGIQLINNGSLKKTENGYQTIYGQTISEKDVICDTNGNCWEKFSTEQIESAFQICSLLCKEYSITQIVGHNEIDQRKLDPGPFFPMERFRNIP